LLVLRQLAIRAGCGAGLNYPSLTQKERDSEKGLDYFGARYYASTQGRFTGADNIVYAKAVDPQTWNQYTYCRNGPLSRIDVDGHNWFLVHKKGGDAWE
jgi:RHS repeat-associated protein